jgi:hypothetical protein
MHLENVKFWHWTIIGLLVGVLFGGVKLSQGPWFDVEGLETLDQPTFDREVAGMQSTIPRHDRQLIQQHHAGEPMLKDLVVHGEVSGEPTHSYWVTGRFFRISVDHQKQGDNSSPVVAIGEWVPFKYRAAVPYTSTVTLPGHYPTVVDFLAAVQRKYPKGFVPYRFAWYEQTQPTMLQLPIAGLLIIGIAWPLTLMLMQGAGLARAPQTKLPKQRQLSPTAKAPKDHSADDKRLADLNAQMDKALGGFGSSATASEDSAVAGGPAPVKALGGADAAPAAPPPTQEELERKYGGEFYPVVKEIHKKKK